jgi:transcriptional regulator with XRE-family HTH domain
MTVTGAQVQAARELLGWTRGQLARQAKVGVTTVRNYELGAANNPLDALVDAIRRALEAAGVEFTNGGQPGVKLRKAAKRAD